MYGNALWKFMFDLLLLSDLMKVIKLIMWFYCNVFRYEILQDTTYFHETATDCFFLFLQTCIYAKVTASTPFESWFKDSPQ